MRHFIRYFDLKAHLRSADKRVAMYLWSEYIAGAAPGRSGPFRLGFPLLATGNGVPAVEEFHLQAVEHARHTRKGRSASSGVESLRDRQRRVEVVTTACVARRRPGRVFQSQATTCCRVQEWLGGCCSCQ